MRKRAPALSWLVRDYGIDAEQVAPAGWEGRGDAGQNDRMPQLTAPDVRFRASFVAAMREFEEADEPLGRTLTHELAEYGDSWHGPPGFTAYVTAVRDDAAAATFWYVEDDMFLGRIRVRYRLADPANNLAGHIGYGVRPSARRRGHATGMLRAVLPHVLDLGIDPALVTCDTANTASRKVIEAAGGEFEDERGGRLRFWVGAGRIQNGR